MRINIQYLKDSGFELQGVAKDAKEISIVAEFDEQKSEYQQKCLVDLLDAYTCLHIADKETIAHELLQRIEVTQLFNIIKNQP